jgi:CRISPR-associated protein Cmr2
MTHLFLFTIGPVQSFIAQARKVHDLYSGSKLLSDLCRVAAKHFVIAHGGKVVFPDIESDSIPNRFLGKITCESEKLPEIGSSVAEVVQEHWRKLFDEPQEGMKVALAELLDGLVYHEAKKQIEQHLDIQWLFQPLADESEETYRTAYDELNKNLNALKNTRPFHTPNESGRKCSLDGERNVVFYRKTLSQQEGKTNETLQIGNPLYSTSNLVFNYDDKDTVIKLRHLQPGEGLSAVSMLKRFSGFEADAFPDTAQFALSETMLAIGQDHLTAMTKLFKHDHPRHLNWQLLFEENLTERYFEKQGLPLSKLEEATKIQRNLSIKAGEQGRKLEKYYGLIVFDGDHMGEWWKGTHLKPGENLEDFHSALTGRLAEFARRVREKYPKDGHRGWVIYAGGDDFLGFFNLHHLTDAIQFLRETYQDVVHTPLIAHIEEGHTLTFSAGVCIAHYKEPLSLVLSQARELEKDAKNHREIKDTIGIGVIPGSGQKAKAVLPFEDFWHIGNVIISLQTKDFSNAFVSKARTELAAFTDKDGKIMAKLLPTAQSLLDRAVSRACNLTGESEEDFKKRKSEKVVPLQNAVKTLLEINSENLSAFFDALDIADFIERQTHISMTKIEQPTHETTT